MKEVESKIEIRGAKSHNLKNIDVSIPRDKLVVITGLSGSGKSSLAFDTIYAEGQRRYIETFSSYARQFLGNLERPDVDKIDGLSPVIAIEQKSTNKSPRSTVGTITEIYDFLRLLYARASEAYSYKTDKKMVSYSDDQIIELIQKNYSNKKVVLLSPVIKSRKGHYRELFEQISKQGFTQVRVDGEILDLTKGLKLDRYKIHDIEIVIDKLKLSNDVNNQKRLLESIKTAMYHGEGTIMLVNIEDDSFRYFSKNLMCESTGISYQNPEPNNFSFNSPKGACESCNGIGIVNVVNVNKIIVDKNKSIENGGISVLENKKGSWIYKQIETIAKKHDFSLKDPVKNIPKKAIEMILYGGKDDFIVESKSLGVKREYKIDFEGIINFIKYQFDNAESMSIKRWAKNFMNSVKCEDCNGTRLNKESLYFKINDKNIDQLVNKDISELLEWFKNLDNKLNENQKKISEDINKEIKSRLQFLINVGLDYLTLSRSAKTLSGGESQRIRLATQIGSQLVGVLYILDEPSIGLHQRDNEKLIKSLESLRDIGNSIIVVEHDKDMMESADHIIDIGPFAGKHGGEIISQGNLSDIKKSRSLTADYLNNIKQIIRPKKEEVAILKRLY